MSRLYYALSLIFISFPVQQVLCQLQAEIKLPQGHTYEIYKSVCVSNDRRQALTCDLKTVIVWDIKTGCPTRIFDNFLNDTAVFKGMQGDSYTVRDALFSPDGKHIFIFIWPVDLGTPGSVCALQFEKVSGRFVKRINTGGAIDAFITADGKYIIFNTYSFMPEGRIMDIESGHLVQAIQLFYKPAGQTSDKDPVFNGDVTKMAWSPDGKKLLMAGAFQTYEAQGIKYEKGIALFTTEKLLQKGTHPGNRSNLSSGLQQFCSVDDVMEVAISPDAGYFAFYRETKVLKRIYIWDIKGKKLVDSVNTLHRCSELKFSEGGDSLYIYADRLDGFQIWPFKEKELEDYLRVVQKEFKVAKLNFMGSYLAVIHNKNQIAFYDNTTGSISSFKNLVQPSFYNYFSLDGRKVLTVNAIDIYLRFMTDTLLYYYAERLKKENPGFVADALLKEDPNIFYKTLHSVWNSFSKKVPARSPNLRVWDLYTGGVTLYIPPDFKSGLYTTNRESSYLLVNDTMKQSTLLSDYLFRIMEGGAKSATAGSKKMVPVATKEELTVAFLNLFSDSFFNDYMALLLLYYRPGVKMLFNDKKDTVHLYAIDSTGWLMLAKDGYFMASRKAARSLFYTLGDNVFSFDQFDLQYNRPDKVLEYAGIAPKAVVGFYRRAYDKRLEKLGFNAADFQKNRSFNAPTLKVVPVTNRRSTNHKYFKIEVEAGDNSCNLDRIDIYINGVPEFGARGYDLKPRKTKKIKEVFTFELSPGTNVVEVTVLNKMGVASLKEELTLTYADTSQKNTLYLVTIGAGKYSNPHMELKYAARDANDVASFFKTNRPGYKNIISYTFTNEAVTVRDILNVYPKLKKSSVNDHVIIYYAGHGLVSDSLDYYLATYNTDFSDPAKGSLRYEDLANLLDGIPARNKVLVMDACHSGEIDKEETTRFPDRKTEDGVVKFRTVRDRTVQQKYMGLANSFELMRQMFVDLRRSTGANVIASAGGAESALEGDKWSNGVFTYCFLTGIKDGKADLNRDGITMLSELLEYVQQKVPEVTGGQQTPTSRTENLVNDMRLW